MHICTLCVSPSTKHGFDFKLGGRVPSVGTVVGDSVVGSADGALLGAALGSAVVGENDGVAMGADEVLDNEGLDVDGAGMGALVGAALGN